MNIKFGMDNYYVRYLKRFLNHELGISNRVLGDFTKNDQASLITYLNLANVKNMFEVQKEMSTMFNQLDTLFITHFKDNEIKWIGRTLDVTTSHYIEDNLQAIEDYCDSVGWEVIEVNEWIDESKDINQDGNIDILDSNIVYNIVNHLETYDEETTRRADLDLDGEVTQNDYDIITNYINTNRLSLTLRQTDRKNYFPNKDMLIFVNQFDGTFMYNYAIRDGGTYGRDDQPHTNPTGNYKIAVYKCKPGQKITLAHSSARNEKLIIGSSDAVLYENIENVLLQHVVEIELKPGQGYQYTATSKAHYICIQCPSSYSDLGNYPSITLELERGDINFDGKIDMEDYNILADYTATGPGTENLPYNKANWTPNSKQLAVMDIPIPDGSGSGLADVDGQITREDAIQLYRFITGQYPLPSLGLASYTYTINDVTLTEGDNVATLLIIDGHYYNYNANTEDYDEGICVYSDYNIPFDEFREDPWIIHEKFFNYLLDMSVQDYTNSEDISYMQKLLKEYYTENVYQNNYFSTGTYNERMRKLVWDYQKAHTNYTIGDLNLDGKIDNNDLILERQVIENMNADINADKKIDQEDFDLLNNYLNGTGTLTQEQKERADVNFDGVIDYQDLAIIQEFLDGTRKDILFNDKNVDVLINRADINQDGKWNKEDYDMLESEVNGTTSYLRNYDLSFMLGYIDVETEALLEQELNLNENISEVSK